MHHMIMTSSITRIILVHGIKTLDGQLSGIHCCMCANAHTHTHTQKENLIPLLVSIGCKTSGSVISHISCSEYYSNSATSSPNPLSSPSGLPLNEISPALEGLKESKEVLADDVELHWQSRMEMSASIRSDEAYAYALQQEELK